MIENLPGYISIIFGLTTIGALLLFYWTVKNSSSEIIGDEANIILIVFIIWLIIQAVLSIKNVYNTSTQTFPPRLLILGILPPVLVIVFLFVTPAGKKFIDSLPLMQITYTNLIRIPVEIVLVLLFLHKAVPQLMTFEGRNFDILSGISAPFIAYFGFAKRKISNTVILIWNFICLGLLLNIVINALLSAPLPFQKFAFDQPNVAILNFPFSWLPTFIVPIVLFGHLVSIRQLLIFKNGK